MYSVQEKQQNVTVVRIPYANEFEQRFLLTADRHWDNVASDQQMQMKHLDQCLKSNAGIIDLGDFFCAMQGKFDKRSSKDAIRPEHCNGEYIDSLVDTAINWFAPYSKNFIRIGKGNHELSIRKRHETDLIARLVYGLNQHTGSKIHEGGFTGWIQFVFESTKHKVVIHNLWYMHGWGGGGPVTKGVIQSARRASYVPDASIIATGHIHEEWNVTLKRDRITNKGVQFQDEQVHIQVPSYKDDYGLGESGFHVESGNMPKPIGAVWLIFHKRKFENEITFHTERAK